MKPSTWRNSLVIGVIAVVLGTTFDQRLAQWTFQVVAAGSVLGILWGVRTHRPRRRYPWWGFAAACGFFFVSYGIRLLFPNFNDTALPGVPLADVVDSFGFLAALGFALRLGQVRDKDKDPTTIIDAVIVTSGVAAVVWTSVILPYAQDVNLPIQERALGIYLSVLTLFMIFAASRLSLGPSLKNATSRMLSVVATTAMLSQVTASAGLGNTARPVLLLGALALLHAGLTALHPSMKSMTEPVSRGIARMTNARMSAMGVAIAIPPVILLTGIVANQADLSFLSGVVISWMIVIALVLTRFGGLIRARERDVSTERARRQAVVALASAADTATTYRSALEALLESAGGVKRARASIAMRDQETWSVVASTGYQAKGAEGRKLDGSIMSSIVSGSASEARQFTHTFAIDNPEADPCCFVTAPLISLGVLRGAVMLSLPSPMTATLMASLGALATDIAVAVEAVALSEDLHRRRTEQRFQALVEHSEDLILVFDSEAQVDFASPSAVRVFGQKLLDLQSFLSHIHSADTRAVSRLIASSKHDSAADALEFRVATDESLRWFEMTATDFSDELGQNGVIINAREITRRKAAEEDRELREAQFRSLAQHSSDLTAVMDLQGRLTYVSPSSDVMLGYESESLLGLALETFVHEDDRDVIKTLVAMLITGGPTARQLELRVKAANGEWKTLDVTLTDLRDDPAVAGIAMNAHDVTERKKLEHDLRHHVLHDDLTGIANRVLFRERVDHALRTRTSSNHVAAVLFIDIDDFKTVNDGLGHDVGDELLRVLAFRLESFVRAGDTAARLGGDEFAVLLEDVYSVDDVLSASSRLLELLNESMDVGTRDLRVEASIGVALASPGDTSEALLRNADVAMYHAKQTGKNRVKLFDDAMQASAFERLELKADLATAIERNEISMHYQPLINLQTNGVVGFEALMRWVHPERGFISPASFIPLAEETGLIVPMGAWALTEAFSQLATWRANFGLEIGMSVNVSPRQLEDTDIISHVQSALSASGAEASWVTLEVTESSGLTDMESRDLLLALRDLGCNIAADDFGTGFASYAALQHLPFTNVKIDRSLIVGLTDDDTRAEAQVRSIIQMGHALGMTITAEGIEEEGQAKALLELGADKGQGYLFGKPSPAEQAAGFLIPAGHSV